VDLDTEIKFVESYIYLQKIRYADNLIIDISPDVSAHSGMQVIPMSVQMLVENAIKHNIISADEPLTIKISMEAGYLMVRNNLQVRHTVPETGNIGLKNIKSRYEYLTNKEFQVINNGDEFVVKVPLIQMHLTPM
jgi:two-component system LytT family sensor kinase